MGVNFEKSLTPTTQISALGPAMHAHHPRSPEPGAAEFLAAAACLQVGWSELRSDVSVWARGMFAQRGVKHEVKQSHASTRADLCAR